MFCMSQLLNTTQTECVSKTQMNMDNGHEVHGFGNFHELLLKTTVDSGKSKVHRLIILSLSLVLLAREIFEKRELLKNSFQKLLVWEGEHHRNDSNEIRKCCYNEVDAKKAYIIHHELEQVITKRLKGSYYVVQAFNSMFLIFSPHPI
mgnify:CR=1 FL=1